MAWYFSYFGGMEHKRYLTSSPGIGTYSPSMSEIWTKRSSPPECGTTNPCPLARLKDFTIPVSIGFSRALADVDAVLVRFVIIGLGNCRFGLGLGQLFAELLVWASDSSPWPDMISIDFGEGLVDTPLLTVVCCKPHSEVASEQGCCLVWGNLDNGNPLDKCAPYAVGSKLAELPWSLL